MYDLAHFHLQAIIFIRNTDSFSAMELLERPEEQLPSVRWETYAGLVNWFSYVIFMQIRHGCSGLNHDYTKSRILGHKASHNIYSPSAWLLIGFLGLSASPDHLPPGCSQLSRCPTHCELEASLLQLAMQDNCLSLIIFEWANYSNGSLLQGISSGSQGGFPLISTCLLKLTLQQIQ